MSRVVIFIRHGVRGFPTPPSPTAPLNPEPLLLADKQNLNLFGHLHSYELGKWILSKFGKPDFLYGDVTVSRTVDTSVSIGYGAGVKEIFLSKEKTDLYFNPPAVQTVETIVATQALLKKYEDQLQKIRHVLEKFSDTGNLEKESSYNISTGFVTGLEPQAYTLGALMLLGRYGKINSPYLQCRDEISPIVPINWNLTYPTESSVAESATSFLDGVCRCLGKYKVSVLVGHEHNAITLAKYFHQPYKVPDFPDFWIPPNSGFLFTLCGSDIGIQQLYLSPDGKFHLRDYGKVEYRKLDWNFDLQSRVINY